MRKSYAADGDETKITSERYDGANWDKYQEEWRAQDGELKTRKFFEKRTWGYYLKETQTYNDGRLTTTETAFSTTTYEYYSGSQDLKRSITTQDIPNPAGTFMHPEGTTARGGLYKTTIDYASGSNGSEILGKEEIYLQSLANSYDTRTNKLTFTYEPIPGDPSRLYCSRAVLKDHNKY